MFNRLPGEGSTAAANELAEGSFAAGKATRAAQVDAAAAEDLADTEQPAPGGARSQEADPRWWAQDGGLISALTSAPEAGLAAPEDGMLAADEEAAADERTSTYA